MKTDMNMDSLKLRPVVAGDEVLLFRWVNDSATRVNSRSPEPVTWQDHLAWFAQATSDEKKVMCVAEVDGMRVGLVRSGPNPEGETEICFSVDSAWRGSGVEALMVEKFLAECVPSDAQVILPIMDGNTGSESVASQLDCHRRGVDRKTGQPNDWVPRTTGVA